MKKILDLEVIEIERLTDRAVRITLTCADGTPLPVALPGQFVNISVPGVKKAFLRRPISVHEFSSIHNTIRLLVQEVGEGSKALAHLQPGDKINTVLPLGNTFPLQNLRNRKILLIGGGVGAAPLLYYARYLKEAGNSPVIVMGARSSSDLLCPEEFSQFGPLHITTDDGSAGIKGLVTSSEAFKNESFDFWVVCGPMPMMKAVASLAAEKGVDCYASLENSMACGIGACLCCVEKTTEGNKCVCTTGPVFKTTRLTW